MKQVVTTLTTTVKGFTSYNSGETYTLELDIQDGLLHLPISAEAIGKIKPTWGQKLLIDIRIPSDLDEPNAKP